MPSCPLEDTSGCLNGARVAAHVDDDVPMPGVRGSNPAWRRLRQAAVVAVLLATLVEQKVRVVEEAHVGLVVERHLDGVVRGQVEFATVQSAAMRDLPRQVG